MKAKEEFLKRLNIEDPNDMNYQKSMEVLREEYSRRIHYGPTSLALHQLYIIMSKDAGKNYADWPYDKEYLYMQFRPHYQSPDFQKMMDFLPSLLLHPCQTTRVYGQSPQISSHEQ